jgi:hypothetical protein
MSSLSKPQFGGLSGSNMGKTLGGIAGSMGGGLNKMPGYTTLPGKVSPGPATPFGPKYPGYTTMPKKVSPGTKPGGILKQPGVTLLGGNR